MNRFVLCAALTLSSAAALAADVRTPNGKRVLFVDNDGSIRPEPGGKRLLFIDGNTLRPEPGGKTLLVLDGDDVRPAAGGIRLAMYDGADLRRGPGGAILMNYRHPDICPTAAANRIYRIDGPELSNVQLTGVLYLLKPELFKISDADAAAAQKSMKEAGAAEDKRIRADRAPGKFMILAGSGRDGISKGTVVIGPKAGEGYAVSFQHGTAPRADGMAIQRVIDGDQYLWVAFGTPKTVGLAVYEIKGGTLEGKWYPWYYEGTPINLGTETLQGPASLDGEFTISSAKAPHTGAAYTGKVTIKPVQIVGALDEEKPYEITWTIGATQIKGIGIKIKNYLVVSSGSGAEFYIGNLKLDTNDGMIGDWFSNKNEMGFYNTNKMN